MSWCDKLAATPSVGLRLTPHFASSDAILNSMSPMFDAWAHGDKASFQINQQSPFDVMFTTDNGFQYGIEPGRVYVNFMHRLKAKPVSGGPPVLELMSQPQPYTILLPETATRAIQAAIALPKNSDRKTSRVGIVANVRVAEEELPPGFRMLVDYLGRPWKGKLESYSVQITAELDSTDKWIDRCVHTLVKPENPDELLSLMIDWQRTFSAEIALDKRYLTDVFDQSQKTALEYFEELAEGNMFDEELLGAN